MNCDKIVYDKDIDMGGMSILNVKAIVSLSGKWSISEDGTLVAVKVKAKYLELEDEDSGVVYCVKIKGGQLQTAQGECGGSQAVRSGSNNESGITNNDGSADSSGQVAGEPSEVNDDDNQTGDSESSSELQEESPPAPESQPTIESPTATP